MTTGRYHSSLADCRPHCPRFDVFFMPLSDMTVDTPAGSSRRDRGMDRGPIGPLSPPTTLRALLPARSLPPCVAVERIERSPQSMNCSPSSPDRPPLSRSSAQTKRSRRRAHCDSWVAPHSGCASPSAAPAPPSSAGSRRTLLLNSAATRRSSTPEATRVSRAANLSCGSLVARSCLRAAAPTRPAFVGPG